MEIKLGVASASENIMVSAERVHGEATPSTKPAWRTTFCKFFPLS